MKYKRDKHLERLKDFTPETFYILYLECLNIKVLISKKLNLQGCIIFISFNSSR